MTRPYWVLPLLGLFCFGASGQTSRPGTAVEAAIGKLSSEDWKTRQQGQNELAALGEEVLPRLNELVEQTKNLEVRSRAEAAIRTIAAARELGPSMLTIHLANATPQAVFAEIARQGRTQFNLWPANLWAQRSWPTINVDVDRKPFWEVVRDVCTRTGCHLQQIGNDHRLSVAAGVDGSMSGPSVQSGPFMIVARNISRSSNVDLSQAQNIQRDFSVGFVILPEPKLRVMQSSFEAEVVTAVDENGASLANAVAGPMEELMRSNSFPFNVTARLNAAAPVGGKRLAKLKCTARFIIETRRETLEIPDLLSAKNLTKSVAGRRLTVRTVQKNGDQCSVAVTLYRDKLERGDWEQFRSPTGEIHVVDARGVAYQPRGWSGGGNDDEMQYTMEFARDANGGAERPGDPDKLVWEIPIEARPMTIPFEFRDLPIP